MALPSIISMGGIKRCCVQAIQVVDQAPIGVVQAALSGNFGKQSRINCQETGLLILSVGRFGPVGIFGFQHVETEGTALNDGGVAVHIFFQRA